jgi:hypothetical protein
MIFLTKVYFLPIGIKNNLPDIIEQPTKRLSLSTTAKIITVWLKSNQPKFFQFSPELLLLNNPFCMIEEVSNVASTFVSLLLVKACPFFS